MLYFLLILHTKTMYTEYTTYTILSWRTWKLKRKAISSNDAEVQAMLEAAAHGVPITEGLEDPPT